MSIGSAATRMFEILGNTNTTTNVAPIAERAVAAASSPEFTKAKENIASVYEALQESPKNAIRLAENMTTGGRTNAYGVVKHLNRLNNKVKNVRALRKRLFSTVPNPITFESLGIPDLLNAEPLAEWNNKGMLGFSSLKLIILDTLDGQLDAGRPVLLVIRSLYQGDEVFTRVMLVSEKKGDEYAYLEEDGGIIYSDVISPANMNHMGQQIFRSATLGRIGTNTFSVYYCPFTLEALEGIDSVESPAGGNERRRKNHSRTKKARHNRRQSRKTRR